MFRVLTSARTAAGFFSSRRAANAGLARIDGSYDEHQLLLLVTGYALTRGAADGGKCANTERSAEAEAEAEENCGCGAELRREHENVRSLRRALSCSAQRTIGRRQRRRSRVNSSAENNLGRLLRAII